ncbi:hypothetical protein ACMATS_37940 (plasmid) [Streptoverticillium reticulum]|uniref:hypothetical protein n=1 Tax=Streptoverticillium reticulum TaxID=1433415 RepID=UPI0039BF90FD
MADPIPYVSTPHQTAYPVPAPRGEVELYGVRIPAAVEITMPDGRVMWAHEVTPRLEAAPAHQPGAAQPMPGWAKGVCLAAVALSTTALAVSLALRIAAPAVTEVSTAMTALSTLTPLVVLIAAVVGWIVIRLRTATAAKAGTEQQPEPAPVFIHGQGGTGGRLLSPGGTGVRIKNLHINR